MGKRGDVWVSRGDRCLLQGTIAGGLGCRMGEGRGTEGAGRHHVPAAAAGARA